MTDLAPDLRLLHLARQLAAQYRQSGNVEAEEGAIRLASDVRAHVEAHAGQREAAE